MDILDLATSLLDLHPHAKILFVHAGENDVDQDRLNHTPTNYSQIFAEIQEKLNSFQANSPSNLKIFFLPPFHRYKWPPGAAIRDPTLYAVYSTRCYRLKDILYQASQRFPEKVILMDVLRLTALRKHFAADGVHFNGEGFHRYCQYILQHARRIMGDTWAK